MDAAVRAIGRKAHREAPTVLQRQHLSQAIKGTDRKVVGIEAPIEEAERLGYIVAVDGGRTAGEAPRLDRSKGPSATAASHGDAEPLRRDKDR